MNDRRGRGEKKPGLSSPPEETELSKRLWDLERRLDENRAPPSEDAATASRRAAPGMAMALRLGADFVAGVVVGGAIGWGFDRLFGTSPFGLIVFVLLGFGAGLMSVLRSAGVVRPGPAGGDDFADRIH
jgi:ATP synthase protein I